MGPLLIVLLVAKGEANDPTTVAASRAARELLGRDLAVEVRETDPALTDAQALDLGRRLRAAAVVALTWESPRHRQARVHGHFEPREGWNDRAIGFDADDAPAERGRTVGFAIASMLPPHDPSAGPANPPRDESSAAQANGAPPPPPQAPARWSGSVDALGVGALGGEVQSPGWGGAVSGRWHFAHPFGARVGVAARTAEIPVAQATLLQMHLAAGLTWSAHPATIEAPFELALRVDLLALRERVTHFSDDDPEPVPSTRWLPGADAAIEGAWMFNAAAGLVASVSTEVAFGSTAVTLHQQRVATVPALRWVGGAGVRARF